MLKTDQNLKILEKKVRQAAALIKDLKEGRLTPAQEDEDQTYRDLPLLRELNPLKSSAAAAHPDMAKLKARIQKLIDEIEKVIG